MQKIANDFKIKLTINVHCLSIILLLLLNYFLSLVYFSNASSVNAQDIFENENFVLSSLAFKPRDRIGTTYTADGANISPPLSWVNPPPSTTSYAIIMQDADTTAAGHLTHWIIYDIPANKRGLREGISPKAKLPDGSIQALNSFQKIGYSGPSPPAGSTHRYFLTLYALDTFSYTTPSFNPPETNMQAFEHFLNLHTKAKSELMGIYGRR